MRLLQRRAGGAARRGGAGVGGRPGTARGSPLLLFFRLLLNLLILLPPTLPQAVWRLLRLGRHAGSLGRPPLATVGFARDPIVTRNRRREC